MTMKKMILSYNYGENDVYPATIPIAMSIFNEHIEYLVTEILDVANDNDSYFVSYNSVAKMMREVLTTAPGEKMKLSQMENNKKYIQELSILMVENNLTKDDLASRGMMSEEVFNNMKEFSLLKAIWNKINKPVKYVMFDDYLVTANEYIQIKKNKWKTGVEEEKVVQYILNFVNSNLVDTSDVKYSLVDYKTKYR